MSKNENFVAYEYKTVNARRASVDMYTDCMRNFGWELAEDDAGGISSVISQLNPVSFGTSIANAAQPSPGTTGDGAVVALRFKRDRRIENKQELNRLERKCEDALAAINNMGRKNNAYAMGVSLGSGIVGAAFVGLAIYSFLSANVILGVAFSVVGAIGWAAGFFSNRRVEKKRAAQSEPMIQKQFDIIYEACEQAYALSA